jgi:hypothetical protein
MTYIELKIYYYYYYILVSNKTYKLSSLSIRTSWIHNMVPGMRKNHIFLENDYRYLDI